MPPRRQVPPAVRLFVREHKALAILIVFTAAAAAARRSFIRIADEPLHEAAGRGPLPDSVVGEGDVRVIWVPYKKGYVSIRIKETPQEVLDSHAPHFLRSNPGLYEQFSALGRILVPRLSSKVAVMLVFHASLLGLRTYLSWLVANLDGRIVRHLIAAEGVEFASGVIEWLALAVPASYANAMIRYLQGRISLEFRAHMVRYIHDLYLGSNFEWYRLTNIDGMEAVNHHITTDVVRFCDAVAKLYSNLGKPTLDLAFFAWQLHKNLGRTALLGIFVNYGLTALILKAVAPPFGRLAAMETYLEGEYRNRHARLIANAEEIAFYDGAGIERQSLGSAFRQLADHIGRVLRVKALYSVIESYVLKYSWSGSGFLFASIPIFLPHWTSTKGPTSERGRMGQFITNKRLMLSMADAGGRIMYSIKDIAELAGFSHRVWELVSALHRVRSGAYPRGGQVEPYSLIDAHGEIRQDYDGLKFTGVPIVVPGFGRDLSGGELIVDPITFEVKAGDHLFITGANGTGKTSVARIVAGLWPVYRGLLQRHPDLAFLPQRAYFPTGTLRDQIIYPRTHAEMLKAGHTDQDLLEILEKVKLAYVPEREGGLNARAEWKDVFSGGEKQRMMFARLLYRKPRYAVIDEATAAVSSDMEGVLYEVLQREGITLITISHRISLLKYHSSKLEIGLGKDGRKWKYDHDDSPERRISGEKEAQIIREFMNKIPELERRRDEILRLLGHSQAKAQPQA